QTPRSKHCTKSVVKDQALSNYIKETFNSPNYNTTPVTIGNITFVDNRKYNPESNIVKKVEVLSKDVAPVETNLCSSKNQTVEVEKKLLKDNSPVLKIPHRDFKFKDTLEFFENLISKNQKLETIQPTKLSSISNVKPLNKLKSKNNSNQLETDLALEQNREESKYSIVLENKEEKMFSYKKVADFWKSLTSN
ncbi:hypothetical protein NGRA_2657, partial [Nosema granulosis]